MNPSLDPLIQFSQASLGYGRRPVLTAVDFTLGPGDFLGVLGPNGAGKSTILKTILGLIPPLKGIVKRRQGPAGSLRFGYVPQKEKLDAIYPLTVQEVAEMGTYGSFEWPAGSRKKSRDELVRRCLEDCGARNLAERRYSELSGGQRQRVLIARALAAEPEVLILDEPLAGIDVPTQKALLTLFEEFKSRRGLTLLMVSHRLQAERNLFTHIAWVENGQVEHGPCAGMLRSRHISQTFGDEA